jgi:predicted dehydrogenase
LGLADPPAVFGSEGTAYVEARETPAVVFGNDETNYLKHTYYSYPNGIPFGALPSEDAYFLAMIGDGRSWPLTLQDARAALVAALAMDRSIAEARPVNLDEITSEVSG